MTTLIIVAIIVLNIAISWWNCYAVGSVWNEVKKHGSWFDKLLAWSAAIQSTAGFSMPILLLLTWLYTLYAKSKAIPASPADIAMIWNGVFNLWYVAIIVPVVGSGFVIWGHSVKTAIEQRDWRSVGTAVYNTAAQAHNTYSMFKNLGEALSGVGDLFDGEDAKGSLALVVIMLVVIALFSSALLTAQLISYYAGKAKAASRYAA